MIESKKRQSGILAHISSLPGKYGIGTLGRDAFSFCNFLKSSGFSAWQVLPLNPHGLGFSPYMSVSSFAGNPLFISPDLLFEKGLITRGELEDSFLPNHGRVDFKSVIAKKNSLLRSAFKRFSDFDSLEAFCCDAGNPLADYASFMTIREELGGATLQAFPQELKNKTGLKNWRKTHKRDEDYYKFEQFLFFSQWKDLRNYANRCGISLTGDVPIYVSPDSCDVWSHPEIFNVSENLSPCEVAGCPPDAFSRDGQLWGNPTYRWDVLSESGFEWWISRLSRCSKLFDTVRLDHFRAFESYWAIPARSGSAACGVWKKGPGKQFFDAVKERLPELDMIAEDLGFLTDEVFKLRDECNLPGMRVLQFAFDGDSENLYLPHKHPENCVVYTATHDNDTLSGFIEAASENTIAFASRYLGVSDKASLPDAIINAAMASRARLAIFPIQDFLNLPTSARMNTPSTLSDKNWRFRIPENSLTDELSDKLFNLNLTHNRI